MLEILVIRDRLKIFLR